MNESKSSKSLPFKGLILIAIVIVIAGIWFLKNKPAELEEVDTSDFALHVTESLDLELLKSYGLPIVIDFGADSCVPCKEMAPVLKELNEELRGKAIIKFVDVWKYQSLADGYPLSVIPTQVFFDKDGKPFTPSDSEGMMMQLYTMKDTGEHVFTTHEGGMTKEAILAVLREMGMDD